MKPSGQTTGTTTRSRLDGEAAAVCRILGIPISVINPASALSLIDAGVRRRQGGYICIRETAGLMLARQDPHLSEIHERAFMVTPDGMPLVWFGRLYGHHDMARVCGPDLIDLLCAHGVERKYRHYFFGGGEGVADRLAKILSKLHPGLQVAGAESPPFRPITTEAEPETAARIATAAPHIVWVGLGSPKQEYWMSANAPHIPGAILIGVGAAFNFHTGEVKRAPRWVQKTGFEWAYRFSQEPARLWRRYLIMAPHFMLAAGWEWCRKCYGITRGGGAQPR